MCVGWGRGWDEVWVGWGRGWDEVRAGWGRGYDHRSQILYII